jgi:hypothetical protein
MELALYEFESAYPRILSHLDTDHEDPATRHCINQATHHLKMVSRVSVRSGDRPTDTLQ